MPACRWAASGGSSGPGSRLCDSRAARTKYSPSKAVSRARSYCFAVVARSSCDPAALYRSPASTSACFVAGSSPDGRFMIWPPSRSYQRSASSRASAISCSLRRRHHMRVTVPARFLSYPSSMLCGVPVLLVILGLLAGAALGWLAARARSAAEVARLDATLRATKEGEVRLERSLRALSQEAVLDQQSSLSQLLTPFREAIHRYERRVVEVENDRIDAYAELRTEVRQLQAVSAAVSASTAQLVAALRAPAVRGRWGEQQLRRIVEAAGMLPHCDFDEQVTVSADDGTRRPDLVVRLAGGRQVVVDAKAPLEAYLTALEARDDRARDIHL